MLFPSLLAEFQLGARIKVEEMMMAVMLKVPGTWSSLLPPGI
jgi:hypothetical protein